MYRSSYCIMCLCLALFGIALAFIPAEVGWAGAIVVMAAGATCSFLVVRDVISKRVAQWVLGGMFLTLLTPALAFAAETPGGWDLFGIPLITLAIGAIAGLFLALKWLAPKTEAKWDDSIVDVVEGACDALGVDPDEVAKRSLGKLKKKVIK